MGSKLFRNPATGSNSKNMYPNPSFIEGIVLVLLVHQHIGSLTEHAYYTIISAKVYCNNHMVNQSVSSTKMPAASLSTLNIMQLPQPLSIVLTSTVYLIGRSPSDGSGWGEFEGGWTAPRRQIGDIRHGNKFMKVRQWCFCCSWWWWRCAQKVHMITCCYPHGRRLVCFCVVGVGDIMFVVDDSSTLPKSLLVSWAISTSSLFSYQVQATTRLHPRPDCTLSCEVVSSPLAKQPMPWPPLPSSPPP